MYTNSETQQFRNSGNSKQIVQKILIRDLPESVKVDTVDYGNDQQRIVVHFPNDGQIEVCLDGNKLDSMFVDINDDIEFLPMVIVQNNDSRKVYFDQSVNAYILRSGRDYKFDSYKAVMEAVIANEMDLHDLSRKSYE